MTDLTDQLDAIQARKEAATPGPWANGGNGYVETIPEFDPHRFDIMPETITRVELRYEDAEFIANAPTDIGFLLVLARKQQAAIDAVKALHTEDLFRGHLSNGCRVCGNGENGYPCPTIEALGAKP